MCGEKSMYDYGNNTAQGSPPHVRGKVPTTGSGQAGGRITPAYAGKSPRILSRSWLRRDYPHMCGEKALSTFSSLKNSGSPPRMRGKVLSQSSGDTREWDHPRMCGEKFGKWSTKGRITGSPPHMRGKVISMGFFNVTVRITPAYAGKSKKIYGKDSKK